MSAVSAGGPEVEHRSRELKDLLQLPLGRFIRDVSDWHSAVSWTAGKQLSHRKRSESHQVGHETFFDAERKAS